MAKRRAAEMSSVAGDMALEAAQNLHKKATRIAFVIEVKVGQKSAADI